MIIKYDSHVIGHAWEKKYKRGFETGLFINSSVMILLVTEVQFYCPCKKPLKLELSKKTGLPRDTVSPSAKTV